VIVLKKLLGVVVVIMIVVAAFSRFLYLICTDNVSNEEYARMAQEIVDQSIEK